MVSQNLELTATISGMSYMIDDFNNKPYRNINRQYYYCLLTCFQTNRTEAVQYVECINDISPTSAEIDNVGQVFHCAPQNPIQNVLARFLGLDLKNIGTLSCLKNAKVGFTRSVRLAAVLKDTAWKCVRLQ